MPTVLSGSTLLGVFRDTRVVGKLVSILPMDRWCLVIPHKRGLRVAQQLPKVLPFAYELLLFVFSFVFDLLGSERSDFWQAARARRRLTLFALCKR